MQNVLRALLLAGLAAAAGVRAEPLTLDDALAAVREHHPALAAARAEAERARSKIDQERAWADPRLSLEVKREGTLRPNTYSDLELTVTQEVPLSRRNELRARSAAAEASVVEIGIRVKERTVLNQARTAYVRIASVDAQLAVNTRLRELLKQSLALAQQGYESGQQMQVDLIETQTELSRLETEENELARVRAEDVARLNSLMQRPTDLGIEPAGLPVPEPLALTAADAQHAVREHHPELLMAARRINAAETQLAVARKNRTPDPEFMLRAKQTNASGDIISAYDAGVAINLPWFQDRRNRAQVLEAQSGIAVARADSRASEAELAGMVAGMHARATLSYTQYVRYRDELIPLARQRTESLQRGYVNGTTSLFAALGGERAVIETEMALVKAQAEYALTTAELDFLTAPDRPHS